MCISFYFTSVATFLCVRLTPPSNSLLTPKHCSPSPYHETPILTYSLGGGPNLFPRASYSPYSLCLPRSPFNRIPRFSSKCGSCPDFSAATEKRINISVERIFILFYICIVGMLPHGKLIFSFKDNPKMKYYFHFFENRRIRDAFSLQKFIFYQVI